MKQATKPQLAKIHYLLNKLGIMEEKQQIILNTTKGRTTSSRDLFFLEARSLIIELAEHDPSERIKSSIFSLAYQANILFGDSWEDKRINVAKLNIFIKEKGAVKKELNFMSYPELITTHRQFEAISKNVKANIMNKAAKKAVSNLLEEMHLTTA